jgi:Trp operon repressor
LTESQREAVKPEVHIIKKVVGLEKNQRKRLKGNLDAGRDDILVARPCGSFFGVIS